MAKAETRCASKNTLVSSIKHQCDLKPGHTGLHRNGDLSWQDGVAPRPVVPREERETQMPDKRRKAHATEIDISNGALFLQIEQLKREVKYLTSKIEKLEETVEYHGQNIPFRIG